MILAQLFLNEVPVDWACSSGSGTLVFKAEREWDRVVLLTEDFRLPFVKKGPYTFELEFNFDSDVFFYLLGEKGKAKEVIDGGHYLQIRRGEVKKYVIRADAEWVVVWKGFEKYQAKFFKSEAHVFLPSDFEGATVQLIGDNVFFTPFRLGESPPKLQKGLNLEARVESDFGWIYVNRKKVVGASVTGGLLFNVPGSGGYRLFVAGNEKVPPLSVKITLERSGTVKIKKPKKSLIVEGISLIPDLNNFIARPFGNESEFPVWVLKTDRFGRFEIAWDDTFSFLSFFDTNGVLLLPVVSPVSKPVISRRFYRKLYSDLKRVVILEKRGGKVYGVEKTPDKVRNFVEEGDSRIEGACTRYIEALGQGSVISFFNRFLIKLKSESLKIEFAPLRFPGVMDGLFKLTGVGQIWPVVSIPPEFGLYVYDAVSSSWIPSSFSEELSNTYFVIANSMPSFSPYVFFQKKGSFAFFCPSPFNPNLEEGYLFFNGDWKDKKRVKIAIYSPSGKQIKNIFSGKLSAGLHSFKWDGRDRYGNPVDAGIYIYKINLDKKELTGQIAVIY